MRGLDLAADRKCRTGACSGRQKAARDLRHLPGMGGVERFRSPGRGRTPTSTRRTPAFRGGTLRDSAMLEDMLRVETRDLFAPLLEQLCSLLEDLSADDWSRPTACPGWTVHGVASHLLGVEVANVSARRDGWHVGPSPGEAIDPWLNTFNDEWVEVCQRLSPRMLIELMHVAGSEFERHIAGLDLDAMGGPVSWAGDDAAPVWLDVAREFMERVVHQQQIRWATSRSSLSDEFVAPVIRTALHALPVALAHVQRPAGTTVAFGVDGDAGGKWYAVSDGERWRLQTAPGDALVGDVSIGSSDDALRLFARDRSAVPPRGTGDPNLIAALGRVKAVLG